MRCNYRVALTAGAIVFGLISLISLTVVVILQQRRTNEVTTSNASQQQGAPSNIPFPMTTDAPIVTPIAAALPTTSTAGTILDDEQQQETAAPVVSVRRTRAPTLAPTISPIMRDSTTESPTVTPPISSAPTTIQPVTATSTSTLDDCLQSTGVSILVRPTDTDYTAAKTCLVFPPTLQDTLAPTAIVQPTTSEQVAAVVQCAAAFPGTTVSARSGAHSYVAGSCRGHIIVDLQQLHQGGAVVSVDSTTNHVTWSAGLVHGQLYGPLWQDHRLLVAGGTENMVGTGGLWLGCGRGLLTQAYGYSCDHLVGIEYVTAQGELKTATASDDDDDDMLWMARGGGGFFPGIVTKFTAQAFPAPDTVERTICYLPNNPTVLREAISAFVTYLDEWNDPANQLFAALIVQRPHIELEFFCYGCSATQLLRVENLRTTLFQQVSSATPDCAVTTESYGEFLLDRASWDLYDDFDDVHVRSQWPEWFDRWGTDLHGSAYSGGLLVPDDYPIATTTGWVEEVATYWETLPGDAGQRTFLDFLSIYPMRGKGSSSSGSSNSAFGSRGAQAVVHFKSSNIDDTPSLFKQHMDRLEQRLVSVHGFPCRGFYNYQDEDLACAITDDEYFNAFFSDTDRLRRTVALQDPDGIFYRLRLQ